MTDFNDMFGNPIGKGDIVLRDSYGGGFFPRPHIVLGNTPARLKVIRIYESRHQPGTLVRDAAMVDPGKVLRYPVELLDSEDRKTMQFTCDVLLSEGML